MTPASPQYFQRVIPHQFDSCPDKLVLKAYQVKYNPKKMKRSVRGAAQGGEAPRPAGITWALPCRLEKEYAAMKSKEMEEQIEIKVSWAREWGGGTEAAPRGSLPGSSAAR